MRVDVKKVWLMLLVAAAAIFAAWVAEHDVRDGDRISTGVVSFVPPRDLTETDHREFPAAITYCYSAWSPPCAGDQEELSIFIAPPGSEPRLRVGWITRDLSTTLADIKDHYAGSNAAEIEFADRVEVHGMPGMIVRVVLLKDIGRAIGVFVTDDHLVVIEYQTRLGAADTADSWNHFDELVGSLRPE